MDVLESRSELVTEFRRTGLDVRIAHIMTVGKYLMQHHTTTTRSNVAGIKNIFDKDKGL